MRIRAWIVGLSCVLVPAAAAAQPRVPDAGMGAVGGDIGLFMPSDDDLKSALTWDVLLAYYLTPRIGIQGSLGGTNNDFEDFDDANFGHLRFLGTLLYNWEFGKIHPHVGAGAGVYIVKGEIADVEGDSESRPGFHLGGGLEYFTTRTVTIKGEVLYHKVSDDDEPLDPSGVTLTVGLKKYF
jgi:opacity protein-like surface antigen